MKFSSAGFLRSLPAWMALLTVGCTQMPHRVWDTASGRSYSNQTRFQVARLQEAQGDLRSLQKAEQAFRDIYKRDPRNVAALHRLAVVTARQNKFDESIAHFQKAIQAAPTRPSLMADYGHALFLKGDLKSAETALKTAVDQNPGNRKAINNLAFVVGIQGRVDESFAIYRKIHSEAEAHNNLGYVHSQRGEGQLAFKAYSKAIALNPSLDSAKHALAQLAEVGNRYQKTVLAAKSPAKPKTAQASHSVATAPAVPNKTPRTKMKPAETPVRKTPERVSARAFPTKSETMTKTSSARRPQTSDYVLDLAGTGPSKPVVQQASAETTTTNVKPIPTVSTPERFRSNYVIETVSEEPSAKKPARAKAVSRSTVLGARRIPEQASRHFAPKAKPAQPAREVQPAPVAQKTETPTTDNDARFSRSAATRAKAARKTRLFNNDGFSWAQSKKQSSAKNPKTENVNKAKKPETTAEPKPFPEISQAAERRPVKTVVRKPSPAPTITTARPKSKRPTVAVRSPRDTRSEIEAPHKPVTRTIQQAGYKTDADQLNLGAAWNAKPEKQVQTRTETKPRFAARSAFTPKTTGTKQQIRQAASTEAAKPKAKNPKRFANYVDWNKPAKTTATAETRKQKVQPTASVAKPVEKKAAPPKASGWAPKRRAVATSTAVKPKPTQVVAKPKPRQARPQTQPSTASRNRFAASNRVRRAPAPRADSQPVRFKIRSADFGEQRDPARGRVRLAPTRREQPQPTRSTEAKGRVRLSAE